nr:immunoglobulin heavy chain junction region [Macaca mulatta]MOV90750.1 immunoglobulin heavy chain junction region [Macaca mulatta]
CARKEDPLDVW